MAIVLLFLLLDPRVCSADEQPQRTRHRNTTWFWIQTFYRGKDMMIATVYIYIYISLLVCNLGRKKLSRQKRRKSNESDLVTRANVDTGFIPVALSMKAIRRAHSSHLVKRHEICIFAVSCWNLDKGSYDATIRDTLNRGSRRIWRKIC